MPADDPKPEHLYRLQYRLDAHPEGFTKEVAQAATEEGFGSCDRAVLFSIIELPNGSTTTAVLSMDGKTGPMGDIELFKAWSLMAHQLSSSPTLDTGRREFCGEVFDAIRAAILGPDHPAVKGSGTPDEVQ